jgi:hypothetical protein
MPELYKYDYAIVRIVPRVEREEFINAGVILSCQTTNFLGSKTELDEKRLKCFAPFLEIENIKQYLEIIPKICAGEKEAGVIGQLPKRARFYWLTAVRSTIIQISPIHSGLCKNPESQIENLLKKYVRLP